MLEITVGSAVSTREATFETRKFELEMTKLMLISIFQIDSRFLVYIYIYIYQISLGIYSHHGYRIGCNFGHQRILSPRQRHPPHHPLPRPSQKVPHDHKLPHHIPNVLRLCHGRSRVRVHLGALSCGHVRHLLGDRFEFVLHDFLHVLRAACRGDVPTEGAESHHEGYGVPVYRLKLACVVRSGRAHGQFFNAANRPLGVHVVLHHSDFGPRSRRHLFHDHLAHQTQAEILARIDPISQHAPHQTREKADRSSVLVGRGSHGHRRSVPRWDGRVCRLQDLLRFRQLHPRLYCFCDVLLSGRVAQFRSQPYYIRLAPT